MCTREFCSAGNGVPQARALALLKLLFSLNTGLHLGFRNREEKLLDVQNPIKGP